MMKLVYRVYIVTLVLLSMMAAVSAQTVGDKNARSEKDARNTAPTVGTGGPVGGPTGLFTVYDGQTLRAGEYTFSAAYSNFDRDPGNVDITEIPVSFQIGVTNHFELFFNTDAYRAVKVNSPSSLSSFYLPNSRIRGISPAAIVLGANGQAVYRPAGSAFSQYPFTGGTGGSGNGANNFPGTGSIYGSILPGIVLQSGTVSVAGGPTIVVPTSFSTAPTYLPDAPFINRTFGESSFSTMTGGAKIRFTSLDNPVGFGVVAYYRYFMDHADDFAGFNQLQRGASPGSSRGDIGATFFADARVAKWANISANVGYNWNGDVKNDSVTLLDRPDELLLSAAADFPVNKYFQPIVEFRSLQYMGGRTPNALENDPWEIIAGARVYPTRWLGFGAAYRYHGNQQSFSSFDDQKPGFAGSIYLPCAAIGGGEGGPICVPYTASNTVNGAPRGFLASSDPHGYIFQAFVGRRNKRQGDIENLPANVTALTLSDDSITLPCAAGTVAPEGQVCGDNTSITVNATAVDPENDVLTYNYTVSAGRIVGSGASVTWDLSGVPAGDYTITAGVDDGCGLCGKTETKTVSVKECQGCRQACDCATLTVNGPAGITNPGSTMTFTANLSGGTQGDVTYNWSVSSGTIVSGQGTPSIVVETTSEMAGGNVKATVDIGGIDPACGCTTSASETAGIAVRPSNRLVDEFGKLANDQLRGRLDNFFAELANDPSANGYIINYGPAKDVAQRERLIRNHISFRRFDASRITIVNGGNTGAGIETKLYVVPEGAENPQP